MWSRLAKPAEAPRCLEGVKTMSVSTNSWSPVAAPVGPLPLSPSNPPEGQLQANSTWGYDQYGSTPGAYPSTGYAPAPTAGGGLNLGRIAAWAAGGFAAFKWVLPALGRTPAGWMVAGVVGAGAFAGNWLYNKLTGK